MSELKSKMYRKPAALIMTLAVSVLFAGCAGDIQPIATPYAPIIPHERFPIAVSKNAVSVEVPVSRKMSRLPSDVRADVGKFLAQYRSSGTGQLAVIAPRRPRYKASMAAIVTELHRMLADAGINDKAVIYGYYPKGAAGTTAPITMTFESYIAVAPECGNWSENLAVTYNNLPHPNFGCTAQHNLASMVANPRDLVTPRSMTPSHAGRRDVVMEKYRQGAATEADTSASEKGGVSEVGE